ncbi:hypothetical protein QBC39DRAFT_346120 [Podospora conica]|nr:hypothetical protein QBC39DRAFT_346120 [Schizothecium conicum]
MAECIAVVGLAASIYTLIEAGQTISNVIQEIRSEGLGVPGAVSDAVAQVDLLVELVGEIKKDGSPSLDGDDFNKGHSQKLLAVIDGCTRQIQALALILVQIRSSPADSVALLTRKAWKRMRRNKDITRIQQSLESYKTLLTLKLVHQSRSMSPPPSYSAMGQTDQRDGAASTPAQSLVFLPAQSLLRFVGRTHTLLAIENSWETPEAVGATQLSTVIIGMGGQGKTQLALEYCRRSLKSKQIEAVFWLDASSPESIARGYQTIASQAARTAGDTLDDKAATAFAIRFISELSVRWLVVLDNFDNPRLFPKGIHSHLPSSPDGFGRWLFTSRHQDVSSLGTSIFLDKLTEDEGLELFFHRLASRAPEFTRERAISIIDRFDRLPLAIDQCAAYIRRHGLTFDRFDELYRQQSFRSKLWASVPQVWDYEKQTGGASEGDRRMLLNLNTTFELSLKQVEGSSNHPPEGVGTMLSFLSLFDRKDVSEKMAMVLRDRSGSVPRWMLGCYTAGEWDKTKFQDILVDLYGLAILETIDLGSEWSSFSLHPIIHEWLRLRIAPDQRQPLGEMAVDAMDRILASRLASLDVLDFRAKSWLLTNLDAARDSARQLTAGDPSPLYSTSPAAAKRFAVFYTRCERTDSAGELYRSLLARHEDADPLTLDRDALDLCHDAALCLVEQTRYTDAEALFCRTLTGKTSLLGPDHESTLLTARQLGVTYRRSLHYAEGEAMLRHVIDRAKAVYGTKTLLYLVALNSLAVNLRYQDRLEEAEGVVRRAVVGILENFGPDHHAAMFTRRCLALVVRDRGRGAEAAGILRVVLRGQERLLGPVHSSTLFTVKLLGGIYAELGDDLQVKEMGEKMQGEIGRAIFQASLWCTDH